MITTLTGALHAACAAGLVAAGQAWDRADRAVLEQEWIKASNAKGVDGARAQADFRDELKAVAAGK